MILWCTNCKANYSARAGTMTNCVLCHALLEPAPTFEDLGGMNVGEPDAYGVDGTEASSRDALEPPQSQ